MVVAPSVLTAWIFGLLFGISYMGTVVAGSMYLLNALDPRAKGLALGLMWCLHQVGAFAASEAGGLSFDALHSYDPIVIGAAASAAPEANANRAAAAARRVRCIIGFL